MALRPLAEFDWDAVRRELDAKANLLLAHALAHYIRDEQSYDLQMRSSNAFSTIERGQ